MKSFAVIGAGRFGRALALKLFDMGHEVIVVDTDHERVENIADNVTQAVCANPMEPGVIDELGLAQCDAAIVGIGGELADSILITMMLKEKGCTLVIAKAQDENHLRVLKKVGADRVVIPEADAGSKMAMQLVSENVFDVIDVSDEYFIADIKIPHSWVGKTIANLNLRSKYGINIIAIKHRQSGSVTKIAPLPDYAFESDDMIVAIGENENIKAISKVR